MKWKSHLKVGELGVRKPGPQTSRSLPGNLKQELLWDSFMCQVLYTF